MAPRWNWHLLWRKWHRWVAVLTALPFLIILLTGLLLQVKKQVSWVQPPTLRGQGQVPALTFEQILAAVAAVPQAEARSWKEIDRLDIQPSRGLIKVLLKNRWEVQLDAVDGRVLQVAYRRSDLIESLHDGSWFHDEAKLWVFLPTAMLIFTLWLTGIYLFVLPWWVKWRRQRAAIQPPSRVG